MDIESLIGLIEQHKDSGSDIAALWNDVNALTSDGATPFLKLNQWKSSDKPVMKDFNEDNEKIDAAVRTLWTDAENAKGAIQELGTKKAEKAVPQKHNLNLLNGFQRLNSSEYFKTEDGQVTVTFKVGMGGAEIPARTHIIANLPAGFRPLTYLPHAIVLDAVLRGTAMACWIGSDGDLKINAHTAIPANPNAGFLGSITYFTA